MDLADIGDKEFVITGNIQEKDATLFVRHIVEDISVLCGQITSITPLYLYKYANNLVSPQKENFCDTFSFTFFFPMPVTKTVILISAEVEFQLSNVIYFLCSLSYLWCYYVKTTTSFPIAWR